MSAIQSEMVRIQSETLPYFDLNPSDLAKAYRPGKWNIRQLLFHIVDTETVMYDRIRRTISNPGQVVWGWDQDAWATELQYDNRSLEVQKTIYTATRASIMELADRFYDKLGTNPVIHSGDGKKTLKDLFDKVVWHNEHHLNQVSKAMRM